MEGITLQEHFATLQDPRVERTKRHQLLAIITIALCAVICGADTWVDIEEFGHAKRAWLETFLDLPNGIPSHDTFGRVFARLDPEQFQACFLSWVQAINTVLPAQQIAIDGKTARRSRERTTGKAAIQMVSAWATQTHLVLAQRHVQEHSNEQTALPILLKQLDLAGCIVSIDAAGCLPKIARQIKEQEGEYVLALKANQGTLYQDVVDLFADAEASGFAQWVHDTHQSLEEKAHGRLERRQYWTISDPECIAYLNAKQTWMGLRSVGMVEAQRGLGEQVSTERRYYIMSLSGDARAFGAAVRSHWGVENGLHWVLDIAFQEDQSRMRKDHSQQNFVVLRHMALNLLKHEQTAKCGIKAKRLKAGWSEDYLRQVLAT
jgi:predicted transposase YbfD/YdcC